MLRLPPQVIKDGRNNVIGLVDYASESDMRKALKELDDSEFRWGWWQQRWLLSTC